MKKWILKCEKCGYPISTLDQPQGLGGYHPRKGYVPGTFEDMEGNIYDFSKPTNKRPITCPVCRHTGYHKYIDNEVYDKEWNIKIYFMGIVLIIMLCVIILSQFL